MSNSNTLGVKNKLSFFMNIDRYLTINLSAGILSKFFLVEATSSFVPSARLVFTDNNGLVIDNFDRLHTGVLEYHLGYPKASAVDKMFSFEHFLFSLKDAQLFTSMDTASIVMNMATWDIAGPTLMTADHTKSYGELSG